MILTVDLDSTLCDTRHRHAMVDAWRAAGEEPDWVAYSMACIDDEPTAVVALVQLMQFNGIRWHVVSSRSEAARELTELWLERQGLRPESVLLCGDDARHSEIGHTYYKVEQVLSVVPEGQQAIHLDDHAKVAEELVRRTDGRVRGVTVTPPGMTASWPTLEDQVVGSSADVGETTRGAVL